MRIKRLIASAVVSFVSLTGCNKQLHVYFTDRPKAEEVTTVQSVTITEVTPTGTRVMQLPDQMLVSTVNVGHIIACHP